MQNRLGSGTSLSSHVDAATIKAAYKKAAQMFHPDTGTSMEASNEKFAACSEAYELLKRHLHEQQWGTSSSAIGGSIKEPPKRITLER